MGIQSDATTREDNKSAKEKTKSDIEDMTIFSSYEILKDGTKIFSAED